MERLNSNPQFEVSVFGQKVVLRNSGDDPELVKKAVELVVTKVEEADGRAQGAAPHYVALLALMDLASEYLRAKEKTEGYKRQVDEKSARLLSWIEAELR